MAPQPRLIFVNISVSDLPRSMAFFGELGFEFDERFCDATAACMVVSDKAYVMLITRTRFAEFTDRPVADPRAATEALLCLSAESREAVDAFADAAIAAGGSPALEPTDHGFMYGRCFNDPDGHLWEVMWMSSEAVEHGPPDMAEQPA
jgi:uncharacterized protein